MKYYHADVFSKGPFTGNGLSVILADTFPSKETMQSIAREFRQFETIFLCHVEDRRFSARIFTIEEELPFAGHPILGAAAVLQRAFQHSMVLLELNHRTVKVQVSPQGQPNDYFCSMNQGKIQFSRSVRQEEYAALLAPLNLAEDDLADLPLEVLSTGLPYLMIPLRRGLEKISYLTDDYESRLASVGAKFAYPFDVNRLEGRSFDNRGICEDVATGSAAGPLGDYLIRHGRKLPDTDIIIHQGRFLNRASEIIVRQNSLSGEMSVSGNVTLLAAGFFL